MLVVIILSSITACDKFIPAPIDESLLSQMPCKFPCWHGIVPGQSTIAAVQQLAKTDSFITSAEIKEAADGTGKVGIRWSNAPDSENRILFNNDLVYSIAISPNLTFTLQDVISKYGEPTAVNASLGYSMEGGVVDAVLSLYYPQIGLQVGFPIKGGNVLTTKQFTIEPLIHGSSFTLVTPKNTLSDFVEEIYPIPNDELSLVLANMTLGWPGFGSLIVINPKSGKYYESTFIVSLTPTP